jgi:hypothetical protein
MNTSEQLSDEYTPNQIVQARKNKYLFTITNILLVLIILSLIFIHNLLVNLLLFLALILHITRIYLLK